jgi:predicted nucleic acid-binding protein
MRYVFDSCVALKWVMPEVDSDKAIEVRSQFRQQIVELLAPDVLAIEIAHALTKAERRGIIQPTEAAAKFVDLMNGLPVLHPALPFLPRAFDISSRARLGVYDCLYVALAEREGCELLTADARLIRVLQPSYPFVVALAMFS